MDTLTLTAASHVLATRQQRIVDAFEREYQTALLAYRGAAHSYIVHACGEATAVADALIAGLSHVRASDDYPTLSLDTEAQMVLKHAIQTGMRITAETHEWAAQDDVYAAYGYMHVARGGGDYARSRPGYLNAVRRVLGEA